SLAAIVPSTWAFINIELHSGKGCSGSRSSLTRASRSCSRTEFDIYSVRTHQNSNNDCLYVYFGSACEDWTLSQIYDGSTSCTDVPQTVRSVKTANCP